MKEIHIHIDVKYGRKRGRERERERERKREREREKHAIYECFEIWRCELLPYFSSKPFILPLSDFFTISSRSFLTRFYRNFQNKLVKFKITVFSSFLLFYCKYSSFFNVLLKIKNLNNFSLFLLSLSLSLSLPKRDSCFSEEALGLNEFSGQNQTK